MRRDGSCERRESSAERVTSFIPEKESAILRSLEYRDTPRASVGISAYRFASCEEVHSSVSAIGPLSNADSSGF